MEIEYLEIDDEDNYKDVDIKNYKDKEFPAGLYYVGDLCYLLQNEKNEIYNSMYYKYVCGFVYGKENRRKPRLVKCENVSFLAYFDRITHGGGGYSDDKGNCYGVAAGLIGIVQLTDEDLLLEAKSVENRLSAKIIEFKEPFLVSSKRGLFNFGDITICTYKSRKRRQKVNK